MLATNELVRIAVMEDRVLGNGLDGNRAIAYARRSHAVFRALHGWKR